MRRVRVEVELGDEVGMAIVGALCDLGVLDPYIAGDDKCGHVTIDVMVGSDDGGRGLSGAGVLGQAPDHATLSHRPASSRS